MRRMAASHLAIRLAIQPAWLSSNSRKATQPFGRSSPTARCFVLCNSAGSTANRLPCRRRPCRLRWWLDVNCWGHSRQPSRMVSGDVRQPAADLNAAATRLWPRSDPDRNADHHHGNCDRHPGATRRDRPTPANLHAGSFLGRLSVIKDHDSNLEPRNLSQRSSR